REFDGARTNGKEHGNARVSILVLDHHRLPADHVGGAVQKQRRRHAAGERAVCGLVLKIEGVLHHHLRRNRAGGFVYVVIESDVGVGVDDAGGEVFSFGVDDGSCGGRVDAFSDGSDLAVFYVDGTILDV